MVWSSLGFLSSQIQEGDAMAGGAGFFSVFESAAQGEAISSSRAAKRKGGSTVKLLSGGMNRCLKLYRMPRRTEEPVFLYRCRPPFSCLLRLLIDETIET